MRVLRALKGLLCCGASYRPVSTSEGDTPDDPGHALAALRPILRRGVVPLLQPGESVWYCEPRCYGALFGLYLLLGLVPLALWAYLLALHFRAGSSVGAEAWLLAIGCLLAVLCALLALNSARICTACHVFTSARVIWAAASGAHRWIRLDDLHLPAAPQGKVARFTVTGASPSGTAPAPLQELAFHYVPDLPALEALLLAAQAPDPPTGRAVLTMEDLPPAVRAVVAELVPAGEPVLWYCHPGVHHVALFSCPLLVLFLTFFPWLLNIGTMDDDSFWLALAIGGVAAAGLLAVWECLQCRVVYLLTPRALHVYYLHRRRALAYPTARLRGVGVWPEGRGAGSLTALFRCEGGDPDNLQVQRQAGFLATKHARPVGEATWHLPVTNWRAFQEAVVARREMPLCPTSDHHHQDDCDHHHHCEGDHHHH